MCSTTTTDNTGSTAAPKSIMKKNNSDKDLFGQFEDIETNAPPASLFDDIKVNLPPHAMEEASMELKDETTEATAGSSTDGGDGSARMKKKLSFGHIEELSFSVIKGDPNFELAFPMALGHKVAETTHCFETYEADRQSLRRKGDALRTMAEDRKQIIKTCKKMHKRRNSIGNGEISRLSMATKMTDKMTDFIKSVTTSSETPPTAPPPKPFVVPTRAAPKAAAPSSPSQIRPKLRRENSIGNGEISRLSAKTTTRASFTKFFKSSKKNKDTTTDSNAAVVEPTLPRPPSTGSLLTFEDMQDEAARSAGLRTGGSSKPKKRSSVHSLIKTVGKITSSSSDSNNKTRASWHGTSGPSFSRDFPSERSVDKIDLIQAAEQSIVDC